MANKPVQVGDRVRIDGGRWDGNSGRVVMIKQPEEVLFRDAPDAIMGESFLHDKDGSPIEMALVQFSSPLDMVGGKLDSVGVPLKRLKQI